MFTGIIEHLGLVAENSPSETGRRLVVRTELDPGAMRPPRAGDSVSVNGCCLTLVLDPADTRFTFDVIPETLAKTTLGCWTPGRRVHLELAATAGTPLGGHLVQGHVDGVGRVLSVRTDGERRLRIAPPAGVQDSLIPKGSIAVDGVSLTLAAVDDAGAWFEVALIPTTLDRTTLGALGVGDAVNIEADMIAKAVAAVARRMRSRTPG
ncbi:MAG: riboflavin synthase [Phycisphaerales bacterium]|nr:riboflavin synthase [Phycisphaerales bacterium]